MGHVGMGIASQEGIVTDLEGFPLEIDQPFRCVAMNTAAEGLQISRRQLSPLRWPQQRAASEMQEVEIAGVVDLIQRTLQQPQPLLLRQGAAGLPGGQQGVEVT